MVSLFERARDTLRRYDADTADELERAWQRAPWLVAIAAGDGRDELVSAVCGEKLALAAPARMRRGERARFRAVRADGSVEEHSLVTPVADREVLVARAAAARDELAERHVAIERVAGEVPVVVRRRPEWWQLWLWPVYLVLRWLYGRKLAHVERAVGAGDDARREAEAAELELASADRRVREQRVRYSESLRAVGMAGNVRELAIDVADGPLPAGVELVLGDAADADITLAPKQAGAQLGRLAELAARAREVALAKRAREAITAAAKAMDDQLARAEDDFRARLAKVDALRIGDSDGFGQSVRARLRPQVVASVHAVIEQAKTHLGGELARLAKEWLESISGAADGDGLAAVVERIELSAPNVTQRIADEVRLVVANGIAGSANDLYPELVGAMKPYGLPPPPRAQRIEVATVELLPSLGGADAKLGGALKKLAGLFKSFDAKKQDTRDRAHERLEHFQEVANAELLDAEPRLHDAVSAALATELVALVALQQQWLDAAQIAEREAVVHEREALAAVAAARDAAFREADALGDELARAGMLRSG